MAASDTPPLVTRVLLGCNRSLVLNVLSWSSVADAGFRFQIRCCHHLWTCFCYTGLPEVEKLVSVIEALCCLTL